MEDTSSKTNWWLAGFGILLIVAVVGGAGWAAFWTISSAWDAFSQLDKTVAVAIVTASATVIASTLAVVVGRYLEGKKERDALHRDKKIKMYDEFLIELFKLFANPEDVTEDENKMVEFLRESQRKFLLWSGPGVIRQYSEWQRLLKSGEQTAQTVFQMEHFFSASRKDLGHSNWGIKRGDMISFVLRHTELFLSESQKNPNMTLAELAELEKKLGLNEPSETE